MLKILSARYRTFLGAAAAGVAVVAVSSGSAAPPPQEAAPKPGLPPQATPPVKADRDGDKVFDDLEARLAAVGPGEEVSVLVSLTAPATRARVAELSRRVGGFEATHRFSLVDAFAASVNKGQARALARVPFVEHVEENSRVRASNASAQSSFGVTKARADAPALDGDADGSPSAYSKADLVAAVIDTGIDAAHVELDGGKVLAFKDFVNGRSGAYDDNGHGTHVAATIAGDAGNAGVAPGAGLVGIKVLDGSGSGTMANVTAAIDWVVRNKDAYGIEAINLSLGAAGCANGTDTTSQAVNNASAAGLVVAVATGNEGPGTCTIGSPGAAAKALTVGAISDLGELGFGLASFSSRGPTADGRVKPDVVAPGVNITSAKAGSGSGYVTYSGTSMATPFAAGVALLAKDANPALTPQQVKDAIVGTALDWARGGNNRTAGTTGVDIDYGYGRLDAYAALRAAGAPLASPPAVPAHELREGSLPGTGTYVDYKIDVADTSQPIAATMILPGISGAYAREPDFDLYLYNAAGSLVARAETVYRQEQVTHSPSAKGTYTLRVRSYRGSGGFFVDVSAGVASADTTAPAAPTGLQASAGEHKVALDWADNSESDLAGYTVYRQKSDGTWGKVASVTGSAYTDSGLTAGTSYSYRVTASDTSANESAPSSAVSATPTADTTAPAAPSSLAATAGDGSVALDWADNSESDLVGYTVYRKRSDATWAKLASVTASAYTDTGLANGTTYTYHVTASDSAGNESSASAEASATPKDTTAPAGPTSLAATAGDGSVVLDWADNSESDLAGYRVYRKDADGTWSGVASVTASSYTDSGLANGTTYTYRVTAYDAAGNESSPSAEASATPKDGTAPAAPTGLAATGGEGEGVLDWADNGESDLAAYAVYRRNADASWTKVASVTASAYTDTNVTAGTAYSYRVTAFDASGNESSPSAEASATPTGPALTRYRPAGFHVLVGSHSSGSVESLYGDDESWLEVSKQGPVNVADYYAHATIAEGERSTLRKLTVDFDGHASHSDVAMTLSVYNWRTGGWQVVDGPRTGVSSDRSFTWSNATSPGDYVSAAGEVRFRVRGERSGGMKTRTDLVRFTIEH